MRTVVLCLNFPECGARLSRVTDERNTALPGNRSDWERRARERVDDGRLRLRGGAALGMVMFGSGRLTLKKHSRHDKLAARNRGERGR
jgi:hypothetical protein